MLPTETPRRHPAPCVAGLLLGLCLAAPALVQAQSYYAEGSTLLRANNPFTPEQAGHPLSDSSQGVPALASVSDTMGNGYAQAWVAAGAGVAAGGLHLDAYAQALATVGQAYAYGNAAAGGTFSDQFALSVPGMAQGTALTATVAYRVTGTLDQSSRNSGPPSAGLFSQASSGWRAGLILDDALAPGPYLIEWEGWRQASVQDGSLPDSQGNAMSGTFYFTVPLLVGTPMSVRMWGSAEAHASVSAAGYSPDVELVLGAEGAARLGHTIAWGGIVSLTDAQGQAVTTFSAPSAASGFDYAKAYVSAVPEPATALLWGLGAVLLAGLSKRRRP